MPPSQFLCLGREGGWIPQEKPPEWVQFLLLGDLGLSVLAIVGIQEMAQKC